MNPLEILQRTPKTNCGECGHPACLAFAVAVARAGAEITLCPYIDLQGLQSEMPDSTKDLENLAAQVAEEHDLALIQHLQKKISTLDFASIAAALGAGWNKANPDILYLRYLGQDVVLGKTAILMDNDSVADPRDQILLYNYVHSCGGRKPDNTWIGMESLPNSISKVKTLATYCEKKIAAHLSGKAAHVLQEVGKILDGYEGPTDLGASATSSLVVPVLPMVPQYLLFWEEEPEDGFEAKAKVLFDHHVLDFLDLESLVFSAERFAERLVLLINDYG
ncbi:MAG: hypothetical protein AMJ60_02660 [Desulfobacterales bacterium SG8_35]|nr:MAG: hypothetical protein AMJ60_02660 [Desulfobacterales bacterium SG8_35]